MSDGGEVLRFFQELRKMRSRCEICGKGAAFGHNVSHSHHKTNRRWMPNVQRARILVKGYVRAVNACTRCMRTQRKHAAS